MVAPEVKPAQIGRGQFSLRSLLLFTLAAALLFGAIRWVHDHAPDAGLGWLLWPEEYRAAQEVHEYIGALLGWRITDAQKAEEAILGIDAGKPAVPALIELLKDLETVRA
jgi:hypothetical protein